MRVRQESEADRQLLDSFEDLSLEKLEHTDHIRLVWLYLNRYESLKAGKILARGLKAYAESKGAFDKFHATITHALVLLMGRRYTENKLNEWPKFLAMNQDIVDDWHAILTEYYSRDLLFSDRARVSIVAPDLKSL